MSSCRSKSAVGSALRGPRPPAELLELVFPDGLAARISEVWVGG